MAYSSLKLRTAEQSELPELYAFIQEAYRGEASTKSWSHEGEPASGERISREALASLVDDPRRILAVADLDRRLVGAVLVEHNHRAHCQVSLLTVRIELHGQAIGSRLLEHAETLARERFAATTLSMEVLAHKRKLTGYYRRRGYRQTGATRPYPHLAKTRTELITLCKVVGSPMMPKEHRDSMATSGEL